MLSKSMRGLHAIFPHWISQKVGGGPTYPPPTEPGFSTEWKSMFLCHFQTLSGNKHSLSLSGCDMGAIPSCRGMSGGCAWDARGGLMSGSLR